MNAAPFAAIDLGSNTFRLLIARLAPSRQGLPWRTLCYRHHIVRLAEGLHDSGELAEAAMQRGERALRDFRHLLDRYAVDARHCRVVATAALRAARNAEVFIRRVQGSCGLRIEIISGEEEARLSLRGCCAALREEYAKDMLLFDIGGGSTEFVRARAGVAIDDESRPLGVVRLTETFLRHDPPATADYQSMIDACAADLSAVENSWQGQSPPATLVGTAGTITTLAASMLELHPYDAETINNTCMPWPEFCRLRDRLLSMSQAQRARLPTIEAQRADLIVAGLAIVEAVFRRWRYQELIVVDAGLLEGAWMQRAAAI